MYSIETIPRKSVKAMARVEELLHREGIRLDPNLEETVGAFDEEGELVATGSAFGRTLRCLAVDSAHRGEGLMALIVGDLLSRLASRGVLDVFVYTKPAAAEQLMQLGFYEIARVPEKIVFLENRRDAFPKYLQRLAVQKRPGLCSAVVMNANPFTLGHLRLLETAAHQSDFVHCFIVSEDVSLVPFDVRMRLVRAGVASISNIAFYPSGDYIISAATFPSYFLAGEEETARMHAALDAAVFAKIAQAMGISVRYVGEEPFSRTTAIYNEALCAGLPPQGVHVRIIPRAKDETGQAISASQVRQLLHDEGPDAIRGLVPESTWAYFASNQAAPVLERIRACSHVRHD